MTATQHHRDADSSLRCSAHSRHAATVLRAGSSQTCRRSQGAALTDFCFPPPPHPGTPGATLGGPSATLGTATAAAREPAMASLVGPGDRIAERVLFVLAFVTRFFHLAEPAQIVR